jgi:hypothetical protein
MSAATADMVSQYTGPGARTFRQYLDVGCAQTNEGTLNIPLSDEESATLKVETIKKPHFEGVSNLNWTDGNAWTDADADEIGVSYAIRGLDRQTMGNCPGGGHGTLVVEYTLVPRPRAEGAQASPAQTQMQRSLGNLHRAIKPKK